LCVYVTYSPFHPGDLIRVIDPTCKTPERGVCVCFNIAPLAAFSSFAPLSISIFEVSFPYGLPIMGIKAFAVSVETDPDDGYALCIALYRDYRIPKVI